MTDFHSRHQLFYNKIKQRDKRKMDEIRNYEEMFSWDDNIHQKPKRLPEEHLLAFAMGTHARVGKDSPQCNCPPELLRRMCDRNCVGTYMIDDHISTKDLDDKNMSAMDLAHANDDERLAGLLRILYDVDASHDEKCRVNYELGSEHMQRRPYESISEWSRRGKPDGGPRCSEMD
jgi:hypothetical protein